MIIDRCRDVGELFTFFQAHPMNDGLFDFEFIKNNPHLYCAYDEISGKLRAYANMYSDDGKIFISGASVRKNMPENVDFIMMICKAFNCDIYADTDIKTAKILLRKAGFKKLKNNLFVRYKNEFTQKTFRRLQPKRDKKNNTVA